MIRRRVLLAILSIVVLVSVGIVFRAIVTNTLTRKDLSVALVSRCQSELKFKRQYRIRAKVERRAFRVQARADQRLSVVAETLAHGSSAAVLTQLATAEHKAAKSLLHLRRPIKLIPLRGSCAQIRDVFQ